MTIAGRIAAWSHALEPVDVPADVADAAKLHLLDTLGGGLAAHARGIATAGRDAAPAIGGHGPATIIGAADGSSAAGAALANGMLCHGLDFDDTHSGSITHVGVVVGPAALAAAEAAGATGRELVAALVAGSEIVTRIGAAAAPGYMVRGFHPTSVSGVFGATIAAARLFGLSRPATASALGIAGSMSSGLFAYLGDGAATKPVHAGWAAHGGIVAAQLAAAGGEGPHVVFEDRFGFFAAYYGDGAEAAGREIGDLGERWETPRIAFKPYPACHFVHACIDATAALLAERPTRADEIARITVAVPDAGVPLVLEPVEAKRDPRTEYEAKFSVQYSVAALIVHGRVGLDTYVGDAIRDPAVLELAGRVEHVRRDFPTYPAAFPGWVRIETRDGETRELELPYQRGGPENPMSEADLRAKFREAAGYALDAATARLLEEAVLRLERVDDVRVALAPLRAAARP